MRIGFRVVIATAVAVLWAGVAGADTERAERYEEILAGLRAECVKDNERQHAKCLAAADQERETSRCERNLRAATKACRDPSTPRGAALVEKAEELDDEEAIRRRSEEVEAPAPPPAPAAPVEPAAEPTEPEAVAPEPAEPAGEAGWEP
jgi:hypothetical protein